MGDFTPVEFRRGLKTHSRNDGPGLFSYFWAVCNVDAFKVFLVELLYK